MGRIGINMLIICLYCFPFVYFSMYQDYENSSMIGYLIMIISTTIIAFTGKFYNQTLAIIVGNIVSAIISFYLISRMMGNEIWDDYFMPLTPFLLLMLVSILNLIPQLIAMIVAKQFKNFKK